MSDETDAEVLLVEDNPTDLELTLHVFKKHNLASRVAVARDGAEALDLIFSTGPRAGRPQPRFKLILLDLKLPKVSGLEVLKRVKDDPATAVCPVVVLTSSRELGDQTESYKLGANSYIVKPVDFAQFNKSVAEVGTYWLTLNDQPPRT